MHVSHFGVGIPLLTHVFMGAIALIIAAPLHADNYRSAPPPLAGGQWSDLSDWEIEGPPGTWSTPSSQQGVPNSGDHVMIRVNHIMEIDRDVTVRHLLIEALALVDFGGPYTLTVSGKGGLTIERVDEFPFPGVLDMNAAGSRTVLTGGGAHVIDGFIYLQANPSSLRIDDADSTFAGVGELFLAGSGAHIEIEDSRRLIVGPDFTLSGEGSVECYVLNGRACLRNEGLIVADGFGTLALGWTLLLEDAAGAEWSAEGGPSILRIEAGHGDTCLAGDFTVRFDGCIDTANVIIKTTGGFTCHSGGTVGLIYYNCHCDDCSTCVLASGC